MESDLIAVTNKRVELKTPNIVVTPYALEFKGNLSKEEWHTAFLSLQHANTVYQWYLGDLVAQADYQWKGEMYQLMMDSTGIGYDSLKHYSMVSSTFSPSLREEIFSQVLGASKVDAHPLSKLSWYHFRLVAPLMNSHKEHAIDFLIRVGREGWSTRKLIDEIQKFKERISLPAEYSAEEMDEVIDAIELPDGWRPLEDIPQSYYGYVPGPEIMDGEEVPTVLIAMQEWELERIRDHFLSDSKMASLISRINTALGE